MWVMRSLVFGEASLSTANETTSPKAAGAVAPGPCNVVTIPEFSASHVGSLLHLSHVGRASLRRPASSSSKKEDQITMAASPAKYVARVVSASWLPDTELSFIIGP